MVIRWNKFFILGLPILFLMHCSNPADHVPEAQVSDSQPVSAKAVSGGVVYTFTPASKIGFIGSKITGSHKGGFKTFSGEFFLADNDPQKAQGTITIDTRSLWADNDRLTRHLKSPDFFDTEKFPTSTFQVAHITKNESGYELKGTLELHGVSKTIVFPADIQLQADEVRLKAEFFIKRFDFGILYKGKADDLIRDEVVIQLDLVATPKV